MEPVNLFLNSCKRYVQSIMSTLARVLNNLSGGRLTPNTVTIAGLLAHLPIAWLIATGRHNLLAAALLVVFGLFDTLDGALARLQNSSSKAGMFLDSFTDRVKEVLLYIGVAYAIVALGRPYMAVWAVAACGTSLLVSYSNAWGEAVLGKDRIKSHALNKAFRTGLMSFEIRMSVLVIGVASGRLILAAMVIAILSAMTAFGRFINIYKEIS